ncbi:hypothetical protein OSTOST_22314, partial [Ostertagia ostertagi]
MNRSKCSADFARRSQTAISSSFRESLRSVTVLVYTICAAIPRFSGLAMLCLVSIAFFMTPNPIACFTRRVLFPVAIAAVFAPITVK